MQCDALNGFQFFVVSMEIPLLIVQDLEKSKTSIQPFLLHDKKLRKTLQF